MSSPDPTYFRSLAIYDSRSRLPVTARLVPLKLLNKDPTVLAAEGNWNCELHIWCHRHHLLYWNSQRTFPPCWNAESLSLSVITPYEWQSWDFTGHANTHQACRNASLRPYKGLWHHNIMTLREFYSILAHSCWFTLIICRLNTPAMLSSCNFANTAS